MFKKFLLIFFLLSIFFLNTNVSADSIPVENVFSDINSNYKYIKELQTLYDKGMIVPDESGKFNPYQLLTRDEFVGITMEVSCKKCIKPNVDFYFINKYKEKPFYDVDLNNKNFYCISDASNNNYINGYDASYKCDNGTSLEGQKPFCVNNNIILEEAVAIILRVSGILTNEQAQKIRDEIYNGTITKNLSDDVYPKNLDGSVYSFYPDFMKALEYEVVEYDQYGNKSTYNLVEVVDSKLRPKKNITKEEFLRIAFVALKANNCLEKIDSNIGLQMNIYDKSCNDKLSNCKLSNLNNGNIYDFDAEAYTNSLNGINNPKGYIWRFYNKNTGEEVIKYGKYIDNYEFLSDGTWDIYLRVIDNDGNTAEVKNTIIISNTTNNNTTNNNTTNNNTTNNNTTNNNTSNNNKSNNNTTNLLVSIKSKPIYGNIPLKISLEGIVFGNNGPFSYEWDFGNGTSGFGKNQEQLYVNSGIYEIKLKVIDTKGNVEYANIFINVLKNTDNLDSDSDSDGILDINDYCPLVKGKNQNNGCPILSKYCSSDNDCDSGFICKINNNYGVCETIELNKNTSNLCNYNGGSLISGGIVCESCPCSKFLDFNSKLRQCDVIFPAITSPDNSKIYSKGEFYQIK